MTCIFKSLQMKLTSGEKKRSRERMKTKTAMKNNMNKEFLTELIAELKEFKREKEAEGLIPTVELMIEEMTERINEPNTI